MAQSKVFEKELEEERKRCAVLVSKVQNEEQTKLQILKAE